MNSLFKRVLEHGPRHASARVRSLALPTRADGHVLMLHTGRSGSTVLGAMLDQHKSIFWDGETIEKRLHRMSAQQGVGISQFYGKLTLGDSISHISNRVRRLSGGRRRPAGQELGEFPKVLGGGGEMELVPGAARASEAEPAEPEDALEVGEEHLDLLSELGGNAVLLARRNVSGHLACAFVDRARDVALRLLGAAPGLESAAAAVERAGAVADQSVAVGERPVVAMDLPARLQLLPGRADIGVLAAVVVEVRALERAVLAS